MVHKISYRSYVTKLTKVCKSLGFLPPKLKHFGRHIAPANCELEDCSKDSIDGIGYWNVTVRNKCYSSHLSLESMRVLVGSDKRKGHYVNKRFKFFGEKMHEDLSMMIFPFIEKNEELLDEVNSTAKEFF